MGPSIVLSRAAILAVVALALAGCGAGKKDAAKSPDTSVGSAGAKVFADAGCGNCHTMAVAGSTGTIGPNLDELRPNQQTVERQVRQGGNGMPAFADKLSAQEIKDVAGFVSTSAGTGKAGKISFKPNDQKVEGCSDATCYGQAFGNIAYNDGPKAALDQLEQLEKTNQVVLSSCHPIAHMIGAGGLLHYEGSVAKAFSAGTGTCGSGYYHGLLQWKLAGVKASQVASVARAACNDPEIHANAFNYYQCDHGLGHGLMLYTAYDLPQALDFCHKLQTSFDQIACSGGVFMENLSSSFGLKTKWIDAKNLLYPCNSKLVNEQDKLYCYLLISSRILAATGFNWKKTADWCRRSEKNWIATCFQSYGRDVAGATNREPNRMRQLCHVAGSGEKECIYGVARDVLNNDAHDLNAKVFCEGVPAKFRYYCFWGIGTIIGTQHADTAGKQSACEEFAKGQDLAQCMSGAGAS